MVRPERFELPTFWFVARRSIQLSYGRKFVGLLNSIELAGILQALRFRVSDAPLAWRVKRHIVTRARKCYPCRYPRRGQLLSRACGRVNSSCGGAYSNVACGAATLFDMLSEGVRGRTSLLA